MNTEEIQRLREQLTASPLRELAEALRHQAVTEPTTDDAEARRVAYTAARALGECLLFGVAQDQLPGQIPLHLVRLGTAQATEAFLAFADQARKLGQQWDAEEDFTRREQLCLDALVNRMEAQAVYTGLTHRLLEAVDAGEVTDEEFLGLVGRLTDALNEYDRALREQVDVLCTVRGNPLLKRWRDAIVPEYAHETPWWLGPGLDEAAEALARDVERDLQQLTARLTAAAATAAEAEAVVYAMEPPRPEPEYPRFPPGLITVRAAARGTGIPVWLVWHDPQRRYRAESRIRYPLSDEDEIRMLFVRHSDGSEATELAGGLVRLAGVTTTIDESGRCSFSVRELRRQLAEDTPVRLEVSIPGTEPLEWPPDLDALREAQRVVEQDERPESTG